jgi:cation transport regulator ChaB
MPREKKLSGRTKKQISHLPKHAKRVYQKTHERALKHYRSPEKREGRRKKEPKEKRKEREVKLERFSRPKGQKLKRTG